MHRCAITIPKFINLPSSVLALDLELEFSIDIELHAFAAPYRLLHVNPVEFTTKNLNRFKSALFPKTENQPLHTMRE